ncbi:DUF4139 domain-containing protein [Elusimicrobiota bacterium]
MRSLIIVMMCVCSANLELKAAQDGVELTVYNRDLGLVRIKKELKLKKGVSDIDFNDVAARIDPTSVHFKSMTDPNGVSVLEQNFEYDLISQDKMLQKYIDKEVVLERYYGEGMEKKEALKGILLSTKGGKIVKIKDQIYINPPGHFILPKLPKGLITKPTLAWKLNSRTGGVHLSELTYLTHGINWKADYVLVTNKDDSRIDLTGWVTIDNRSGATYLQAKLKLVAGDVNQVRRAFGGMRSKSLAMEDMVEAEAPGFKEKAFFEYHLYTLGRPSDVKDNQTKQIELVAASDVPVKKLFIYDGVRGVQSRYYESYRTQSSYGAKGNKKIEVILEFKNSKDNNLGMPLPVGKMRVYKTDPDDDTLQFIGEDSIDHTPKDEEIKIKLGNAFDVVGERKQTSFKINRNVRGVPKEVLEKFRIELRNHKETPVTVRVVEHLYRWSNWKIIEPSQKYRKKDSRTIEFDVAVPKDGKRVLFYTVKYSW